MFMDNNIFNMSTVLKFIFRCNKIWSQGRNLEYNTDLDVVGVGVIF